MDSPTTAGDSNSSDTFTVVTTSSDSTTGEVCQKLPYASKEVFPRFETCAKVLNELKGIDDVQYAKALLNIRFKRWRQDFMALPAHSKADFVKSLP